LSYSGQDDRVEVVTIKVNG